MTSETVDLYGYERFVCALFKDQVVPFEIRHLTTGNEQPAINTDGQALKLYSSTGYVQFVACALDEHATLFFTDVVTLHAMNMINWEAFVSEQIIDADTIRRVKESARNLRALRADLGQVSRQLPTLSQLDRAECERRSVFVRTYCILRGIAHNGIYH